MDIRRTKMYKECFIFIQLRDGGPSAKAGL